MLTSCFGRALKFWVAAAFVSGSLLGCGGGEPEPIGRAKVQATLSSAAVPPETGVWWNPAASGTGYVIERQGNAVLLGSYMYESSGAPVWYLSVLALQSDGSYAGALNRYSGGQTIDSPYRPPAGSGQIATVALTAQTARTATLTVQPSDGSSTITTPIERFTFSAPAFAPSTAMFESGLWWNEAESGRGFFVEVQGSQAVLGSYMYDESGQPVWYITTGSISTTQGLLSPTHPELWWSPESLYRRADVDRSLSGSAAGRQCRKHHLPGHKRYHRKPGPAWRQHCSVEAI